MDVGWWALIVSGASLLFSGATYWRNRTPTPKWVTDVTTLGPGRDGKLRVTGTATNRGRDVARDVKFEPRDGSIVASSTRSTRMPQ